MDKITASHLNFYYGSTKALKDVNLSIAEHKVTAFIGPSGCGKSTFLRTLNRMNDLIPGVKLSGEVDFHGQDLYGSSVDPTWLRKQIGMVFQSYDLFPHLSVLDNITIAPIKVQKRKKEEISVSASLANSAAQDKRNSIPVSA